MIHQTSNLCLYKWFGKTPQNTDRQTCDFQTTLPEACWALASSLINIDSHILWLLDLHFVLLSFILVFSQNLIEKLPKAEQTQVTIVDPFDKITTYFGIFNSKCLFEQNWLYMTTMFTTFGIWQEKVANYTAIEVVVVISYAVAAKMVDAEFLTSSTNITVILSPTKDVTEMSFFWWW